MFYNHWLNISVSALGYNFPRFQHKVPGNSEDTTTRPTAWHGVIVWDWVQWVAWQYCYGPTSRWASLGWQLATITDHTAGAQLIGAAVSSSQNILTASHCSDILLNIEWKSKHSIYSEWEQGEELYTDWCALPSLESTEVESRCKYLILHVWSCFCLQS